MSVVLGRLGELSLDRAHFVTVFFWEGFGSGHRMRRYFDSIPEGQRGNGLALADSLGLHRDDPFCVGWGYGWAFGKG